MQRHANTNQSLFEIVLSEDRKSVAITIETGHPGLNIVQQYVMPIDEFKNMVEYIQIQLNKRLDVQVKKGDI